MDEAGSTVRITGLGGLRHVAAKAVHGQRRHGHAPLTAALALLGGEFELSACRACTSARLATWSMRCASWLPDRLSGQRRLSAATPIAHGAGLPPLAGRRSRVRGDVSSQFLTALLMALPLAAGTQAVVIEVVGELISKPYIHITLQLLARFGIAVGTTTGSALSSLAGSRYQSPAASMSRQTPHPLVIS